MQVKKARVLKSAYAGRKLVKHLNSIGFYPDSTVYEFYSCPSFMTSGLNLAIAISIHCFVLCLGDSGNCHVIQDFVNEQCRSLLYEITDCTK